MDGYNKTIPKIFFIFFMTLLMILTFKSSTITVKAISDQSVMDAEKIMNKYDGISNWKPKSTSSTTNVSNDYGTIPIGGNFSLGYAFGSARDINNNVKAGDNTITKNGSTATVDTAPTINNSKINIFLDYGGKYYGILHQGNNSYIGGTPEKASDTSIDFALVNGGQASAFYNDSNILAKATNKLYYTGTDDNKNKVFKIVGYFTTDTYFEIVLRPSITGAPVVSRELYVYNSSANNNKQFQTFYGEDTGLNPDGGDTTVDNVPMFAIGDKKGLYLLSGANYTPASKLFVTNNLNDGFQNFMGRVLTNPTYWYIKGRFAASSSDIQNPTLPYSTNPGSTQNGDTDATAGQNLLQAKNNSGTMQDVVNSSGKQDSAYVLRWPYTSLAPGGVAHFASNIGATIKGYAVPTVQKTYKNLTSSSGNHVGDTLRFTLKVRNDGYDSQWNITNITDNMPTGLTITSVPDNAWLSNGNINFNPNVGLKDNTEKTFTFDAKINNLAPYQNNGNLTNTASFTGENNGKNDSKTLKDSVKIPVETPTFKYRFTKQVRNETTNPGGAYSSEVSAKQGNVIDYHLEFISNGSASLKSAKFADSLPSGLELVPGSVKLNNSTSENDLNFDVGALGNGQVNTIDFQATVTSTTAMTASNTAYLNSIQTTGVDAPTSISTEVPAIVNIENAPLKTAFVKVPDMIDFGSVHSTDVDRFLTNIRTDGQLVITHTNDTPFQVGVSYDNDGDDSFSTKKSDGTVDKKLIQDSAESLYFNQDSSDNSSSNWKLLTNEPISINDVGFSGPHTNYDLTDYVGLNKWKLRVPANSKSGAYSGKITWSIYDTIQNN